MPQINTLVIRTPEGIVFSQPLAGPLSRFLAWTVDGICISVISSAFGALLQIIIIISPDVAAAAALILFFACSIGYGILTEWYYRGQSVGKKVLRLRVVDADGLRLQFSQIVIRNLLRFIDQLPLLYLVGGVACLVNRRSQRLGDVAANTVVVRIPRVEEPDLEKLLSTSKFNSLRKFPHLEARLRQRVSPAEARVALQALSRRKLLEPADRIDLFASIAGHFKEKVDFPQEAIEGITDEQYLRNVIDLLYRHQGDWSGSEQDNKSDTTYAR